MSNSPLVNCVVKSPNNSGPRTHSIDRITPHCIVGQLDAETIGYCFSKYNNPAASCNYGIGTEGNVVLVVDEDERSWCSSSKENDQRAVTIECASDKEAPWAFNDAVYAKLVELCTDICQRNGKTKLLWLEDMNTTLNYNPASDEMVLTVHRWFKNKACPGDWMMERMSDLAGKVTAALNPKPRPYIEPYPVGDDEEAIYRIINPNSGEHLITRNLKEANYLIDAGWNGEGLAWIAPKESDEAIFRLYAGNHFLTGSINELHKLTEYGWHFEGVALHSGGDLPVHRVYCEENGDHLYTVDENEYKYLVGLGWIDEGAPFNALRRE